MGTHKKNSLGFTIIEVSLVIAITGLSFLAMMSGITFAVERQRFTDSVYSTGSYIQSQYSEVVNVINNRPSTRGCNTKVLGVLESTPRGSDECVILGRALVFPDDTTLGEDSIKSYAVVGLGSASGGDNQSSLEFINSASPYIVGDKASDNTFTMSWGAQLSNVKEEGATPIKIIAILRSPKDGSINVYRIDLPDLAAADKLLIPDTTNAEWKYRDIPSSAIKTLDKPLLACIKSDGVITTSAALILQPSGSQDGVTTVFDKEADDTGVCV